MHRCVEILQAFEIQQPGAAGGQLPRELPQAPRLAHLRRSCALHRSSELLAAQGAAAVQQGLHRLEVQALPQGKGKRRVLLCLLPLRRCRHGLHHAVDEPGQQHAGALPAAAHPGEILRLQAQPSLRQRLALGAAGKPRGSPAGGQRHVLNAWAEQRLSHPVQHFQVLQQLQHRGEHVQPRLQGEAVTSPRGLTPVKSAEA
mmetsp:Transcript_26269/g.62638  ORF Transcript_26269/g.62638 Transcript_26269/m.62638 type:complete len:201 (-) Transcript_26269:489-1091(-)